MISLKIRVLSKYLRAGGVEDQAALSARPLTAILPAMGEEAATRQYAPQIKANRRWAH